MRVFCQAGASNLPASTQLKMLRLGLDLGQARSAKPRGPSQAYLLLCLSMTPDNRVFLAAAQGAKQARPSLSLSLSLSPVIKGMNIKLCLTSSAPSRRSGLSLIRQDGPYPRDKARRQEVQPELNAETARSIAVCSRHEIYS